MITNTYIVVSSNITNKLKNIEHFKFDLGSRLIDFNRGSFLPADVIIQKHYMFHNEIINLIGYIGSLPIYTHPQILFNNIKLVNEKNALVYNLDDNLSLYDNINLGLDIFFNKFEYINKPSTIKKEEKKDIYIKPNKNMSGMTESERILYARNLN